ncbi:CAAX amino terminal protease family protein [Roseibacterium elongatum DSM 19469]|uniref:CAAX amino terminal protease family protein n=1 Tax=Roseicyclus elongatus DSM 19469 TaxID=1294273 RepID=W8RR35_9RHOB|nr:type II CAAX endopeptidase family protein [Roseibacterium elongatum]AHM03538.1 CAAX amino terminal protease family protein [Roseibacterium elongatum DSM 19469]
MQYTAHAAFVAPARAHPQVWRLVVGLALAAVVYFAGIFVIFGVLLVTSGPDGAQWWMASMTEATGPTATLLLLATFIGMALGPMAAARLMHKRSAQSLFGGSLPRLGRHFAIAAGICVAVYGVTLLIPTPEEAALQPNLELSLWASFLPLALVGVLVQTGAEEVLFRGYIQQQLAARFRSPLVWMLLPSVLFALAHYQPDLMGDNTWYIVLATGVFALLAADLTALTGNIGAAWGLHFANNCAAILVVGSDGPLSGLALYTMPVDPSAPAMQPLILLDIAVTVAIWLAIRVAVMRRAA